jgi:DNA-binding NarL/FixJ family response regulator
VLLLAEDARLAPSSRPDPGGPAGMTRAVSAHELAEAIRAVAAGFRITLSEPPAPQPAPPAPVEPPPPRPERDLHAELLLRSLSDRERQILALLARGYSNRRIAEACYLSLNTVRTHVQNVLVKLGVHSKLEAAALAVRQGLVQIEDHPA